MTELGVEWPSDYDDLIEPIRSEWGVDDRIVLVRALGGLSGARVFVVDLVSTDYSGEGILKLSAVDDADAVAEGERQIAARSANSAFGEAHIPELIASTEHDGKRATLSSVAGRGLEYITPWDDCGYKLQLATARQLSRDLLEEWNEARSLTPTHISPRVMLEQWLGYRLGEESGRIGDFVREVCGFEATEPTYIDRGEWFPNPLAFARGVVDLPPTTLLRALVGNVHGDLHGNNVLSSTRPPIRSTYYLIDFADFHGNRFLFFDHGYFEMSHLLRVRSDADPLQWKALVDAISRFPHPMAEAHLSSDDLGHAELVSAIRGGVESWVERHLPHRMPTLDGQYLLARVAAGLTFVHRRVPESARRKAFLYAASNLRDFLNLFDVSWPKWGPPMLRAGGHPLRSRPRADVVDASGTADPVESVEEQADRVSSEEDVRQRAAGRTAFEVYRARPMIAVLPFENRSGDSEQEYFADSITDELLIELSKIDWLMTVSRDSSFAFKGRAVTAPEAGRELEVPYVAEGSVRRRADSIRITVALSETRGGMQIWGERYDVRLGDLYDVEDDITTAIVARIESALKGSEEDRARRKPPDDLDAWDLSQRAMWHLRRATAADDELAEKFANQAIEVDPDFATPHAVLAMLRAGGMRFQSEPIDAVTLQEALAQARAAVELDPSDGFTHRALAAALLLNGQPGLALAEAERSAELNPSSAEPHLRVAEALLSMGELGEALKAVEISIALSPMAAYLGWAYICKGFCEYGLGDLDDAEQSFKKSARRRETAALGHIGLAVTAGKRGDSAEAAELLAQGVEMAGPGGFVGLKQLVGSWHNPLVDQVREGLIGAGLPPDLWRDHD